MLAFKVNSINTDKGQKAVIFVDIDTEYRIFGPTITLNSLLITLSSMYRDV